MPGLAEKRHLPVAAGPGLALEAAADELRQEVDQDGRHQEILGAHLEAAATPVGAERADHPTPGPERGAEHRGHRDPGLPLVGRPSAARDVGMMNRLTAAQQPHGEGAAPHRQPPRRQVVFLPIGAEQPHRPAIGTEDPNLHPSNDSARQNS
jgi:hypothetical protein